MTDSQENLDRVVSMFVEATPPVGAPITDWRRGFEGMAAQFDLAADAHIEDVETNGVPGKIVSAPGAATDRIIVHFHSGGYVQGSAHAYRDFAYRVSAAAKTPVLVPDYRLAPENLYPAAVDDARAVYDWALQTYGAGNVIVSGDSAGGGLAMALLLSIRDSGLPAPAGGIGISPLLDLAGESASMDSNAATDPLIDRNMVVEMGKVYIGELDPHENPYCSPVYGKKNNLPPLLLMASNTEVLRDDIARFADGVRAESGQVETDFPDRMTHIWTFFPFLEQAAVSVAKIGDFAQERFAKAS